MVGAAAGTSSRETANKSRAQDLEVDPTVYRAQDLELGREVAVKQIHSQFLADARQLDRYWGEAQLLAALQHPNIVTIYDLVRERGWLIMELVQGNLGERLRGRPLDLVAILVVPFCR